MNERSAANPLWRELGETMRALRTAAGVSLREAEVRCGRSRGLLSANEHGKARPTRTMARWYDEHFDGNGLLLSCYTETRSADLTVDGVSLRAEPRRPVDALEVVDMWPSPGTAVEPEGKVEVRWRLRNVGSAPWRDRLLWRVGAVFGTRVIAGDRTVPVPDAEPGEEITVSTTVRFPAVAATFVAYWAVVDRAMVPVYAGHRPLSVRFDVGG